MGLLRLLPVIDKEEKSNSYTQKKYKCNPTVDDISKIHLFTSLISTIFKERQVRNNPVINIRRDITNVIAEEIAGAARDARNIPFAKSRQRSDNFSSCAGLKFMISMQHLKDRLSIILYFVIFLIPRSTKKISLTGTFEKNHFVIQAHVNV